MLNLSCQDINFKFTLNLTKIYSCLPAAKYQKIQYDK